MSYRHCMFAGNSTYKTVFSETGSFCQLAATITAVVDFLKQLVITVVGEIRNQ